MNEAPKNSNDLPENDGDLVTRLGMSGQAWGEEFAKRFGVDEEMAVAWFCNAIMAGFDQGRNRLRAQVRSFLDRS